MSLEQDIAQIAQQEKELCFASFSEQDAWALGSLMRQAAVERALERQALVLHRACASCTASSTV